MDADANIGALREMCAEAALWSEGGQPLVYLPVFRFLSRGEEKVMDLLLAPFPNRGYETRLFFEHKLPVERNWSQHVVCGRQWHAVSWDNVKASLPWAQVLAGHLRAVA